MCVGCCLPFVTEAASGVSDVNPNGLVVRLSFVMIYGLVFLSALSFVVSEIDHGLLRSIRFLRWICCSLLTLFWIQQTFVSEMDPGGVVVRTFSC